MGGLPWVWVGLSVTAAHTCHVHTQTCQTSILDIMWFLLPLHHVSTHSVTQNNTMYYLPVHRSEVQSGPRWVHGRDGEGCALWRLEGECSWLLRSEASLHSCLRAHPGSTPALSRACLHGQTSWLFCLPQRRLTACDDLGPTQIQDGFIFWS